MSQARHEPHADHGPQAVAPDPPAEAGPGVEAGLMQQAASFDGPPEPFLSELLATQCELGSAEAGVLLRYREEGRLGVAAAHPALASDGATPLWLAQAEQTLKQSPGLSRPVIKPVPRADGLYGLGPEHHLVLLPVDRGAAMRGAAAFLVRAGDETVLARRRRKLELSLSLLSLYEMRRQLSSSRRRLTAITGAVEILSAVNELSHFKPAAMGLCNELASRWGAERVSLGALSGRYVKLQAMSHIEKVNRKTRLSQQIESAMEECLDQDTEIIEPRPEEAVFISRATGELARQAGSAVIASLPLREGGEPVAVLTIERDAESPFTGEDLQLLRLVLELVGPRLLERRRQDRWVGARAAAQTKSALAQALGPQHTWAKVTALALIGLLAFLFFAQGTYKTKAPFTIEATEQRIVAAPFAGYLASVAAEPGETIEPGEPLASLQTAELKSKLAQARAERISALKEAAKARQQGQTADAQIARAEAEKQAARIDWFAHQINAASIRGTTRGVVLSGRLKEKIGGPVEKGKTLFRIAPLESLRAELRVPDDEIHHIREGQRGELAAAAHPGRHVGFVVERINPRAEVKNQQNVFRVRVRLEQRPDWLRPGMEGVAKAHVGPRSYAYIWCHDAIEWLRMKLWI